MKSDCNIIKDLLPLYVEGMLTKESIALVEAHLKECQSCATELSSLKNGVLVNETRKQGESAYLDQAAPLRILKKTLLMKKLQTILLTAFLVAAFFTAAYAALDAPRFVPYSQELLTLSEMPDNFVISFGDGVTDCRCTPIYDVDMKRTVFQVEAWNSLWDQYFGHANHRTITVPRSGESPFAIYYIQNNGSEDVCIYSTDPLCVGAEACASLTPGYYLIVAVGSIVISVVLWFVFRKQDAHRQWVERALLIPISYLIGHIAVLHFRTTTYAIQHDFPLIIIIALLVYFALLLGHGLIYLFVEIKRFDLATDDRKQI
ncbi:MAG: zf-HC2 domain-containing protein [Oscillospiraceae bacterium]|nr:zf-HC2 domain-containing protein [Oscillospiraceae bacterium]